MARLGDVCTFFAGTGFPNQYQGHTSGEYPFFKVGDISRNVQIGQRTLEYCDNYINDEIVKIIRGTIIPQGTVVFAKIGEALRLNRRAITICKCLIDNNVMGLKPIDNVLTTEYFYYLMTALDLQKYCEATTVPSVRKSTLEKVEIAVPSIEEQNKIVNILNKLNDLIYLRKQQLAKLDELVKARFVEMFGDSTTNSKELKIVRLSEIAEYFNGLTYRPENVSDVGTIVLRSSNIQGNQLDFADTVRVNCQIKERLFIKENDILMCSRNGSARLVGKVALIKGLNEPMSFGAFMMIIRSQYYPYLMTYFQTDDFRRQIKTGATTTINQVTGRMLDEVELPVPKLGDMTAFATFTEKIFRQKLTTQQSLDKMEVLRKSLMQEYFG